MLNLLAVKIVSYAVGFLSTIFILSKLPVDDFGLYSYILILLPFLNQICSLSTNEYLTKNIICRDSTKQIAHTIYSTSLIPLICMFLLCVGILILDSSISYAVILFVFSQYLYEMIQRITIALGDSNYIALNDFLFTSSWFFISLLIYTYKGELSLSEIFLARASVCIIAVIIFSIKNLKILKEFCFSTKITMEAYKFGLSVLLASISFTVIRASERFLLEHYSTLSDVAHYSYITIPSNLFYSLFVATIYVSNIRYLRLDSENKLKNVVNTLCRLNSIFILPVLVFSGFMFNIFDSFAGKGKFNFEYYIPILAGVSTYFLIQSTLLKQKHIFDSNGKYISKLYTFVLGLILLSSYFIYPQYGFEGAFFTNLIFVIIVYFFLCVKDLWLRFIYDILLLTLVLSVSFPIYYIFNDCLNIYLNGFVYINLYFLWLLVTYKLNVWTYNDIILVKNKFGYG